MNRTREEINHADHERGSTLRQLRQRIKDIEPSLIDAKSNITKIITNGGNFQSIL